MSQPMRPERLPMSPADLDAGTSPLVLLDAYLRHVFALAAARSTPVQSSDVGERAVSALTLAHVLVADLFEERWPIVRDALQAGVTIAQLSAATGGLQPDELAAGLTAWADRRHAAGTATDADHAAVLALVRARLWGVAARPGWRRSG